MGERAGAGLQAVRRRSGRGVSSARRPPLSASSGRLLNAGVKESGTAGKPVSLMRRAFLFFAAVITAMQKGGLPVFSALRGKAGGGTGNLYCNLYCNLYKSGGNG